MAIFKLIAHKDEDGNLHLYTSLVGLKKWEAVGILDMAKARMIKQSLRTGKRIKKQQAKKSKEG